MVELGPLGPPNDTEPKCCDDAMVWDTDEKKWLCVWCEKYLEPQLSFSSPMKFKGK